MKIDINSRFHHRMVVTVIGIVRKRRAMPFPHKRIHKRLVAKASNIWKQEGSISETQKYAD